MELIFPVQIYFRYFMPSTVRNDNGITFLYW